MKRDFEKYFPLPMQLNKADILMSANGDILSYFSTSLTTPERRKAYKQTIQYLVQCANLMPEAVALLDDARDVMKWTCEICDGEASGRCGGCDVKGIGSRIAALLAKLEGGAETE